MTFGKLGKYNQKEYRVYTRSYLSRFVNLDDNKVWE